MEKFNLEKIVFHRVYQSINPHESGCMQDSIDNGSLAAVMNIFKYDSKTGLFTGGELSPPFSHLIHGKVDGNKIRFYDGRSIDPKLSEEELKKHDEFIAKGSFIGEIKENNGVVELEGISFYAKASWEFLYDENALENIKFPQTFEMYHEIPGVSAVSRRLFSDCTLNRYQGMSEFTERFHKRFYFWRENEGKKYIDAYEKRHNDHMELEKKQQQDAQSLWQSLFPPEYARKAKLDRGFYRNGAEHEIYNQVKAVIDPRKLEIGGQEFEHYSLSDKDAQTVSELIGCNPLKAEECYSLLRHLSSRHGNLGNSAGDLRDTISWIFDPMKKFFL